jgi:uncharacterized membrane protein
MTAGSTRMGNAPAVHPLGARARIAVAASWLATLVGAIALIVASGHRGDASAGGIDLTFVGLAIDVVVFSSVGTILTLRLPENRVGLVLMVGADLMVLTSIGYVLGAVLAAAAGADDPLANLLTLLGGMGVSPTLVVGGALLALVFPDGRLPGPRWRWPVRAIAAALSVGSLLIATRPGPIGDRLASNPLGIAGVAWLDAMAPLGEVFYAIALFGALLLALSGVAVRFRRSRGVEREQLKWFAGASVAVIVLLSLSLVDASGGTTAFGFLAVWSLSLPPIAIGIAVLRYRLYEIDRIISRTISYGLVTAALVSVYGVAVLLLQTPLGAFTGGETVAVAASTLVAAALFQPLRRRIQAAVDRRFNRARYDAERTVASFAAALRDDVDPTHVRAALLGVVDSAIRPHTVAVWIRGEGR